MCEFKFVARFFKGSSKSGQQTIAYFLFFTNYKLRMFFTFLYVSTLKHQRIIYSRDNM